MFNTGSNFWEPKRCPCCGACSCCGRGGWQYPFYQVPMTVVTYKTEQNKDSIVEQLRALRERQEKILLARSFGKKPDEPAEKENSESILGYPVVYKPEDSVEETECVLGK